MLYAARQEKITCKMQVSLFFIFFFFFFLGGGGGRGRVYKIAFMTIIGLSLFLLVMFFFPFPYLMGCFYIRKYLFFYLLSKNSTLVKKNVTFVLWYLT